MFLRNNKDIREGKYRTNFKENFFKFQENLKYEKQNETNVKKIVTIFFNHRHFFNSKITLYSIRI